MPRVSTDTTDESPKRAPRKRAVRRVVTKSEEAPVRKPRTARAVKVKIEENAGNISSVSSPRRAPTQLSVNGKSSATKKYAIVLGALFVMLAGAAFIGFSDVGQIDVTARINEQNQKKSIATQEVDSVTGESVTVPVQNTPPAAISNLRPRGSAAPTPEPAPAVASTTEDIASSTEAEVVGEVAPEEAEEEAEEEAAVEPADATLEDVVPVMAP